MERQFRVWLGSVSLLCGVCLGCANSSDVGGQPAASGKSTSSGAAKTHTTKSGSSTHGGSGGSGSMMTPSPAGNAGAGDMQAMAGGDMPKAGAPLAMNECGLHTKYAGDEFCILPPPPDKGFQLHTGPSNYDNPEAQYILGPGQETTADFSATSGNDKDVFFYYRQIRQRTGAHHNIITSGGGGDTGLGQRIATSNNLAADDPPDGKIAPENVGVGISMPAFTPINVNLHSINTSDKDELREVWVNFWYVDPSKVTDPVHEMFNIAPMGTILPGQDVTFGSSCAVSGTGRMLWAYGHRHANNVRFSVWRSRGAMRDLVYQGYNYEDPLVLNYSSTVKNAVPDTGPNVEGGWSGVLDMMPGDVFDWECRVVNNRGVPLNFTNNTFTGEMCILDAETVGATCP